MEATELDLSAARQPGAVGKGYGVKLRRGVFNARLLQCLRNNIRHPLGVRAACQLRHHAAILAVQPHLGINDIGQNPAAVYNGGGGFVAGCFNA